MYKHQMTQPINNYLKILSYLKTFEGDEEYHEMESVLVGVVEETKHKIFRELKKEELILLTGGPAPIYSFGRTTRDGYGGRDVQWNRVKIGENTPFKGKITFKGSKHLRDELQLFDNNKINIHVGNNSTANMILNSSSSTISNNASSQIDRIIETLKKDKPSLNDQTFDIAISTFELLKAEIDTGKSTQDTWTKVLSIGANISSIGSLVLTLMQQFPK